METETIPTMEIETEAEKNNPAESELVENAPVEGSEAVRIPSETSTVSNPPEAATEVVGQPKEKRKNHKRKRVAGDEDCDEIGYADEENRTSEAIPQSEQSTIVAVPEPFVGVEDNREENVGVQNNWEPNVGGDGEGDVGEENCEEGVGVVEENCEDFEAEFGTAAREEDVGDDADSGDEIWDDERIP
ncbi:ring-infected erythrocyte surface antigen-like [Capsella rubella]|uniref:ring-infected erythrocyte surface antigen-like n=1 Tax=Capsella rubella TaxID=81985 RepID=UPI000CD552C2|nr:ring-infected erythrocyte surface antigen-like [Capsella rubella]